MEVELQCIFQDEDFIYQRVGSIGVRLGRVTFRLVGIVPSQGRNELNCPLECFCDWLIRVRTRLVRAGFWLVWVTSRASRGNNVLGKERSAQRWRMILKKRERERENLIPSPPKALNRKLTCHSSRPPLLDCFCSCSRDCSYSCSHDCWIAAAAASLSIFSLRHLSFHLSSLSPPSLYPLCWFSNCCCFSFLFLFVFFCCYLCSFFRIEDCMTAAAISSPFLFSVFISAVATFFSMLLRNW